MSRWRGHKHTLPLLDPWQTTFWAQLTCDSQQPILKLLAFEYIIQDINYEDQSFSVVDRRWIDDTYCPHPFISLTFNYSVFHIGESNLNLLFFYNCTQELVPQYQPIPCNSNETHHCFCKVEFYWELDEFLESPKEMRILCLCTCYDGFQAPGELLEWLHRGFLLGWTAPSCSSCLENGGQCGYLENEFKRFCRDRPNLVSCNALQVADMTGFFLIFPFFLSFTPSSWGSVWMLALVC
eukprot:TRINITY_DN9412_c0_g1_i3.p1 TRINITY_DN9412_c0_g1~~TRINITY_DN9412_c0_g1_i3.p1  ORF type:complete len:238 (+),score=5.60 TRINITY_DN9412_c0_g1_i3:114-827(+)